MCDFLLYYVYNEEASCGSNIALQQQLTAKSTSAVPEIEPTTLTSETSTGNIGPSAPTPPPPPHN